MKPEIKGIWLGALRSGEYVQGKSVLRDKDNKFCCLGVLCHLYILLVGSTNWVIDDYYYVLDEYSVLPQEVMEWSGLKSNNGAFGDAPYQTLASLNDVSKYTFDQIADFIEENF